MSTLSPNDSSTPAGMPTFVFRLVNFDSNGTKLGKRKYGYAAKTGLGNDLDETVYQGIISRAEQAFSLQPQQYSVYLVLSGKRTKELGESDINAGSPFRIADFEGFKTYRNLMAAVQLDPKNRKVVNLCIVPLHYQFKEVKTVPLAIDGRIGSPATSTEPAATSVTAKSPTCPPLSRDNVTNNVESSRRQSQAQAKAWTQDQAMLRGLQGVDTPPQYAKANSYKQAAMPGAMPGTRAAVPVKQEPTVNPQDTLLNPSIAQSPAGPKLPTVPSPHAQPVFGWSSFADYAPKPTAHPYRASDKPPVGIVGAPMGMPIRPTKPNGSSPAPSWPDWTRAAIAATPSQQQKFASPFAAAAPASKPAEKPTEKPAPAASATATNVHPCAYTQPSTFVQDPYKSGVAAKGPPAFAGWGTKLAHPVSTQTYVPEPQRKCKPRGDGPCRRDHRADGELAGAVPATKPAVIEQKKAFHGLIPLMEKFVNDFNKTMAEEAGDLPSIKLAVDDKPASAPAVPVLTAQGEKEPVFPKSVEKKSEEIKKVEEEVKHKATCDVCSKWIIGVRHKCLDCPDWDCCEKCFGKIGQAHPNHSFALIRKQGDIVWKSDLDSTSKSVKHYGVHCDSCNKPIYDIRYKCTHADCPDFDLCADCEADPVSYAKGRKIGAHDYSSHYMLKIRQPISRFSDGRPVRDILQQALKSAQTIVLGSASQSAQQANTAELPSGLHSIPGSNDKTLIVDVDVPYNMLNGKKEISISLDLGKNEKGETVILGPSATGQDSASGEDKVKVEAEASPVKVEETEVEKPVKTEEPVEEGKPVVAEAKEDMLNAAWVADVTFEDGTAVAPGAVFNKIWKIKNTGTVDWPSGCQLVRVSGLGKTDARAAAFGLPELAAGESANIIAKDVTAPDMPGKFMAYYRFVGPDGTTRFGDRLWLDVNVEEEEGTLAKSRNASEHSLHSSSIVTPTLSVNNATDYEDISAVTSPRTAPSELPESEGFTAAGEEDDDEDDFVLLSDGDDNFAEIDSVTSSKN